MRKYRHVSHSTVAGLRAAGASYATIARFSGMTRRHVMRLSKPVEIEKAKRQIEKAWRDSTCNERETFIAYLKSFVEDREGMCWE